MTSQSNSNMAKTKNLSKYTRILVSLHQADKAESAIGIYPTVGATIRKWKTYKTTDNQPQSETPCKISVCGVIIITGTTQGHN